MFERNTTMPYRRRSDPEKPKGGFTTKKEKWLTVILVILIICILGLIIAVIVLAIPKDESKEEQEKKSCLSDRCLKAAVSVMDKMDDNIKPCNDFWKYSCGDFIERHPVFAFQNNTVYSSFSEVAVRVSRRLLVLLTEEDTKDTISPVKKIKQFFKTCIDPNATEEANIQQSMMKAAEFGGIPFVTGSMKENVTRIELLTNFAQFFATFPFLAFDIHRNIHTGDGNAIYLTLPKTYNKETILSVIESIAKLANQTDSYNVTEITTFMDTYKELADSIPTIDMNIFLDYKPRNISEILKDFPHFDLESYINGILSLGDTKLENDSGIVIIGEEQVKNFTILLSQTSLQTMLNIMSTSLFIELHSVLNPSLKESKLHGENLNTQNTRPNLCLELSKSYAPRLLGKMYVNKYFPEENRKKSNEIADYMGKALIAIFERNKWLDVQSKKQVLDKAKELLKRKSIGYNDKLISDDFLEKRFENVTVDDSLYDNIFEYNKALMRRKMKSFSETLSEDSAIINTVNVNAQYNAMYNTISIPSAILQSPFFDVDVSQEINFGGVGTVIGHEMMHAFDNTGIKFNEKGNIGNVLTNDSQVKFDERTEKLIEDYSDFLMPRANKTVNGTLTLGENIADLSGMKVSFLAYSMWKSDTKWEKTTVPGLSLSSEQLFFTSFTQVWCESRTMDLLKSQLKTDVHSPAKARTTVTLQNFKEFSVEYGCPKDAWMNPSKKIEIW
ncbi:neprilysin isoform X2 [Octopus sinensis]|uniref:Neprilysin isoform X2 n=1 Tax=Octopus sinensis TaxID=2607531 RepID=A0A6P7SQA9_9MOLL|nr:neprilysin isoform X2 [Octopus sinensis]